jgi:hypothetical protein
MTQRPRFPFVLPALLLLAATAVTTATAQVVGSNATRIYRLAPESAFEEGCFDPCLCPIQFHDDLLGTMRLAPAPSEPGFTVFNVRDVNWLVPGLDYWVTGSGTYRIGGQPLMHRLELDLLVADREVQHYDSGWQLAGAATGEIAITISMNNLVCRDTVFRLVARPIVMQDLVPYTLYQSNYAEGCYGPCLCVVVTWPLKGRFGLLKLASGNTGTDFAVLGFDGFVRQPDATTSSDGWPVTGDGLYHVGTSPQLERMRLALIENGVGPVRFDSGTVPGDGNLRRITVDLAENGFACFDRVYSIDARRRSSTFMDTQVVAPEPVPPTVEPVP